MPGVRELLQRVGDATAKPINMENYHRGSYSSARVVSTTAGGALGIGG